MPASAKVQPQDAIGGTIGGTDRTGEIKRDAKNIGSARPMPPSVRNRIAAQKPSVTVAKPRLEGPEAYGKGNKSSLARCGR